MDERGLGKQLQAARQAAGLTQQQLCHQANLSFSTLTKIERGAIKAPSIFTIQAIAGALNVGLDELMGLTPPNRHRNLQKTKSGASFIYFDVNGCLVYFYQRAFAKIALATGVSPEIIESAYLHYNDDACRGALSLDDFNKRLASRMGVESVDWGNYYLDVLESIEEMHDLLRWTAEHYRVGLLTNIMPTLLSSLMQRQLVPQLNYDVIIDSSVVGSIKPEFKIFEIAQAQAGVAAHEILFIDDSRPNLIAAEKLGWNVMRFDDSRPKESVERIQTALEPAA